MTNTASFIMRAAFGLTAFAASLTAFGAAFPRNAELTREQLADKIKGGWLGQMIGCTYGGPTEFKYKWETYPDDKKVWWNPELYLSDNLKKGKRWGGLYDDVYVDITFMDIFERVGLDKAKRSDFKRAVALAEYSLWAANRQARVEYLDGKNPEEPVSWRDNPHSDAIDFQIEADFAGLMSPALPKAALKYCDLVGRAINGGDGYFCGVYVATMYSLAFASDDINEIVSEALKVIPKESKTRAVMEDIIRWHAENPKDWHYAWQKHKDKYADSNHIYAPHNCAYILIGLLYGEKDFGKTIDISTRCGLDSDCNPASAGGILGTMLGYSKIPEKFAAPFRPYEKTYLFCGTTYSLEKTYAVGYSQALRVMEANGCNIYSDWKKISVKCELPQELPNESVGRALKPRAYKQFDVLTSENPDAKTTFNGAGFDIRRRNFDPKTQATNLAIPEIKPAAEVDVIVDGKRVRTMKYYYKAPYHLKNADYSKFDLPQGEHTIELKFRKTAADFPPLELGAKFFSE